MSKEKSYINTLYLAIHLALNILVVALIIDIISVFVPIKHFFAGYHLDLHSVYPPNTLEKNLAIAAVIGFAAWYYQKRKAKHSDGGEKYHLPNLRQLEEFFKSKF